jgi:Tfp pilus assembly protein PilO
MKESSKTVLSVLFVVVLALAFWLLLLSPKRDKASELSERSDALSAEVAGEQAKATEAVAAKEAFPSLYRQLVLLGKAVPGEAATPSLLVQLKGVGDRTDTSFLSITLGSEGGGSESESEAVSPEEAGSLLPLGSSTTASGLPTLPYTLEFDGGFFAIADFLHGLDSLVQTKNGEVDAKGRLVTIDKMVLAPPTGADGKSVEGSEGQLSAIFQVTTYVAPTGQGLTAGASPEGPSTETEATPAETEATP